MSLTGNGSVSVTVSGAVTGSGAAGQVALWDTASDITGDAGLAFTGAGATFDLTLGRSLRLGAVSTATGQLKLANASSANLTILQAGNAAAARTYTWPTNFGAAGTVLTDAAGDGTLSWATGGATPAGSGSELQYRSGATTFGAVTGSSVSGGVVTLAGGLLFTDNTYDIGASGATRPRTGYFGTSVIAPVFSGGTRTKWEANSNSIFGTVDGNYIIGMSAAIGYYLVLYDGTVAGITSSLVSAANGVVQVGTAGGPNGWVMTGGLSRVASDVTNATTTMAAVTGLSATLIAGRKYTGRMVLFCANSVAAEGIKVDFDGGSATMTSFRAHGTIFDTALLLSTQTTAIATDFAAATVTGDAMIEIYFGFVCNAAGTFIPRFAENTTAVGTATIYANSYMDIKDCA